MTFTEYINSRTKMLEMKKEDITEFIRLINDWDFFTYVNKVEKTQVHDVKSLDNLLKNYRDGYPISYLTEYVYFYSLKLKIKQNVFIPRKETEIFVEYAINLIEKDLVNKINYKLLDIGTGSGAIAITICKQFPNIDIIAIDTNKKALKIAKENASRYNLDISFLESNLFEKIIKQGKKFDFIISNPPYIDYEDPNVDINVKKYEPHDALFANNNGLAIIETIFKEASHFLTEKGYLGIEFGFKQKKEVEKLAKKFFPDCKLFFLKDYNNNYRFLFIQPNFIQN